MNQAVQLLARGLQDTWLTGNPQTSFYRSTFKRHTQFGSSIEQFVVPDTGKIVINTKSDLLGYTYLTAHDKATGTLVPNVNWSNIISTVDLNIGNQIIATHDIVYINTIQKALEADTYSSRSQTNTFQPLGFFFDKQALPILALRYTDVRINITWVSAAASKQYVYKCWAHCIRLADEERQFFSTATHRILIPQMQRVMVSNEPNFHGPLKYIAAPCTNYANVYVNAFAAPAAAVSNLQAAQYNGDDSRSHMDSVSRCYVVFDQDVTSDDDADDDQPFFIHVHRSHGRHGLYCDNHVNRCGRTRWVNITSDCIQE